MTRAQFNALVEVLQTTMEAHHIPFARQNQLLALLAPCTATSSPSTEESHAMNSYLRLGSWVLLAALAAQAQASTVQISVTGREGQPLTDAVVTLEPVHGPRPPAPAPVQAVIGQQKMQFLPAVSLLPVGSRVRFNNLDSWDHHVARPRAPALSGRQTPSDRTAAATLLTKSRRPRIRLTSADQ